MRCLLCLLAVLSAPLMAVEAVVLNKENIGQYRPDGKEVDCIYGDYVLRSDSIWAVIAQPAPWRQANMFVNNVGGALIDLTSVADNNDQLSAYYANLGSSFSAAETKIDGTRAVVTLKAAGVPSVTGGDGKATPAVPEHILSYELRDGDAFIVIRSVLKNPFDKSMEISLLDTIRLDTFDHRTPAGAHDFIWGEDKCFYQAYAVAAEKRRINYDGNQRLGFISADGNSSKITLQPNETLELVRRIFPARDSLRVTGPVLKQLEQPCCAFAFTVKDEAGAPAGDVEIVLQQGGKIIGAGRTLADGSLSCALPAGKYDAKLSAPGRGKSEQTVEVSAEISGVVFKMPIAPKVIARITNDKDKPTPCKVQFKGINGTANPKWGNNRCRQAVENLFYSENGSFTVPIDPGEYEAIISYGHEYDVVRVPLKILPASTTPLHASLKRAVKSQGWVSADFHSHSSPSGDNTTDQRGRVLNLLCENLEFNPCTEHNRIDSYTPHLKALGVEKLMGTCTGIECTGNPLLLAHHNVFPLHMHEHTQDGGGPERGPDPGAQIKRAAEWDNNSEKIVQQDHPDIGWLVFDKDGDGTPDGGWKEGVPYISIIEVHPIHEILKMKAMNVHMTIAYNSTIFNWLQLLNQGFRIPGVVNTDSHYNHHGSGGIFNFVRCDEEIPGNIEPLEIVRHCKKGHIVMSTGPFMEVKLGKAIPGDDIKLKKGKGTLSVKVQCPNWLDIDRVQVLVNGRPDPRYNFTRETHAEQFSNGVVKFDQKIELELKEDAHIIVVAVGEKHTLGDVMGEGWGKINPVAISNPIFADVDDNGFTPNKDTLGAPLPVKGGKQVEAKK